MSEAMQEIRHRYTSGVIYSGEHETRRRCVEKAVSSRICLREADLSEADLRWADLRGAYLSEADLRWATLRGSNLRCADLIEADLRWADLREADLICADLSEADLRGAYLRGADLSEADLSEAKLIGSDLRKADLSEADLYGAKLNWQSHDLLSEILWRAADTESREMLAAYVGRKRAWCWDEWSDWDHPEREWALRELAKWVQDGDDAPEAVRKIMDTHGREG